MNKKILSILLFCFPLFLIAQSTKKVLIVGVDGCRPDALQVATTPHLDLLKNNGIFSSHAWNDDITISGPGWSAILCGVWSDKHLVTGNDFTGNNYDTYPSFFKYINDYDSDLHTVSICHWAPINDFIIMDDTDFKLNVSSDMEVASQAAAYLAANDPDVVFLHFDDVDHAGHSYGFSPDVSEYTTAIEGVDTHIGTVIQAIEQRPNYAEEDWLILVTTDHGGLGTSHGGNSDEEKNVFVIASGNNIAPNVLVRDSSILADDVFNCLGDSVELKFDGADDYVQVAPHPIFDFGSDQDFSIECRVRTSTAQDVSIIGNKDWDSGIYKGFVFSFKLPAGPEWKVNIGDGNNRADINTGGAIADNEWHTLSVTFDRDGWMKMYQDGTVLDSTDISFIGDITTGEGLFLGTDINGAYDYSGAIAEVRVWNTLLNAPTIMDWHCDSIGSLHPNFNNLIGYWKFNEGIGNSEIIDHSPNSNNGSIIGASWHSPDSIVVYDYSAMPRLTDIVPTALAHLCIPVDTAWGLEGTSLIPECMLTNLDNQKQLAAKAELQLFPNPAKDQVQVHLNNFKNPIQLEIYDSAGNKIYQQSVATNEVVVDVSNYAEGMYVFIILQNQHPSISKKIKILSD